MHIPVMLYECLENLKIKEDGTYIDGTVGGGGHSIEILKRLSKNGKLICIDQDVEAISRVKEVLAEYSNKTIFVHENFSNIKNILTKLQIEKVDGILLDLGVSSFQLDEAYRGFSYMHDAPLDMRMNLENDFSAFDVVNYYAEDKLYTIIKNYGEERFARRIAQFIIAERIKSPIKTTFELVSVIKAAIPKKARIDGPHPAKRTFQAIRIEVNGELSILEQALEDAAKCLTLEGRLCVISFHSLEDRIVKNTFKTLKNPCTCPIDYNKCICHKKQVVEIITKKPIIPSSCEIENNHRSRSAKLRVVEAVL